MKNLAIPLVWMILLAFGAPDSARAQSTNSAAAPKTELRLELQIRPVGNAAEMMQLMRQNSVRVALQRHRLWQQAVTKEEQRAEAPQRRRYRQRLRTGTAKGAGSVARVGMAPVTQPLDTTAPKRAVEPAPRSTARSTPRPMAPLNLRQLLRQGRSGDAARLERKLRARIREQQRLRDQLRNRSQQGSSMGARRGGHSGR